MGAEQLAIGVGVAASVFLGAYVALDGFAARPPAIGASPAGEALGRLILAIRALPAVAASRRRGEVARRRAAALRQLPAMLDILTLGLSAGLSFDASLELYCQRGSGELATSLSEAMLSWRLGIRTRGDALLLLADELDVAALRRFASAVCQALAFGSPLAAALEQQAQVIRDEQRAELEAEIERTPVRMLVPLGTLIVPAMLLAILGPLLGSSVTVV